MSSLLSWDMAAQRRLAEYESAVRRLLPGQEIPAGQQRFVVWCCECGVHETDCAEDIILEIRNG